MLNSIKQFFSSSMIPAPEADAGAAKKDIRLAACALLLELAHADDEFTDDERQHLESAVRRQFGLDSAVLSQLRHIAEGATIIVDWTSGAILDFYWPTSRYRSVELQVLQSPSAKAALGISRCPPDVRPKPPGICTECVAS